MIMSDWLAGVMLQVSLPRFGERSSDSRIMLHARVLLSMIFGVFEVMSRQMKLCYNRSLSFLHFKKYNNKDYESR